MAVKTVRVVVEIAPREVIISLTDTAGARIEEERFHVSRGFPDVSPPQIGRDVFNLLYQCASDAIHRDESDGI